MHFMTMPADKDRLNGGAAADRFRFSTALSGTNIDTVTNFQHLVEEILPAQSELVRIGAAPTVDGFRTGVALDAIDRILYHPGAEQLSATAMATLPGA